jgi:[ribosomal protein S5]-alanine N-acetyltransferase
MTNPIRANASPPRRAAVAPMAFFRTINFSEPLASIPGDGVSLRTPQMTDYAEWSALREASRDFLKPWEPIWPADDLTRSAFRRRVRRYAEDLRTDQGYAFLIVRNEDGALVGGLTLANIRRGVAQAASVGYWMGLPFTRHGYMTAAVRAVIPFAFATLRLHRLEAACIPTNAGSIRLLEKNGFMHEGYARGYLCINGIWQDHLLYARLPDAANS